MTSGGLVGDDLVNEMLAHRVSQPDCLNGFLLDGYPRTVEQAEFLDRLIAERGLPKPIILHLDVPLDALVGRLTSRRQCPTCGRIYNLLHQPPKKAGVCDDDGTLLITRKDDQEEVVRERLRTYEAQTRPVLAHYQDRKLLSDPRRPVAAVYLRGDHGHHRAAAREEPGRELAMENATTGRLRSRLGNETVTEPRP